MSEQTTTASDATREKRRPPFESILKWVGAITAILSLMFGLYQLVGMISADRERQRNLDELHKVASAQLQAGNYPSAWTTLEQAARDAEAGGLVAKTFGRLSEDRRKVREAQEDVAMIWLENISVRNGATFSETVDKVLPSLHRGVANASGTRKPDLIAHIGWAYFLKSRDGQGNSEPATQYHEALRLDGANPYANAYLGHWTSWQRGRLADVREHFAIALASGRAVDHVRSMELSAYHNYGARAAADYVRVVNEMRKRGERLDATTRSQLLTTYYTAFNDERFPELNAVVPPAEQMATLQALFADGHLDASKRRWLNAYVAMLQEASGSPGEALKTWVALRAELPTYTSGSILRRADEAIRRLSARR